MASTWTGDEAALLHQIEALADSFTEEGVFEYVRLFSRVIAGLIPSFSAEELEQRYYRIRRPRRFEGDASKVSTVFVLSRVTLGADIAVTSLALRAALARFPASRVVLVGGRKSRELFEGEPRLEWLPLEYARRAPLEQRLAASLRLKEQLDAPGSLVIDPDSRLTQLGLLPVCQEEHYYFFESRSWGGAGAESISSLTADWLRQTFGVGDLQPWIAPRGRISQPWAGISVSFGVGENLAKRVPDPFEEQLLRGLAESGLPLLIDTGPGGEEAERVRQALRRAKLSPAQARTFEGSFAQFALWVAASRLYVGYDSAGQHAAAALGVPTVTIFAGFPSERFLARWQPSGPGPKVTIRVDPPADPLVTAARTLEAAYRLLSATEQA